MNELTVQPKYLTVEEASAYLRVPVSQIYQLTSAHRLRHYKPGRRLLFLREDLDSFVLSGVVQPVIQPTPRRMELRE